MHVWTLPLKFPGAEEERESVEGWKGGEGRGGSEGVGGGGRKRG